MTHISCPYTLKAFGVSKKQSIQYDPSETYVDDIKEEREAVNRRFGHIPWDVRERILRKEYEENMVQPKETKRNILVGPWCKGEAYD
jgi:deoxyribodipyrimidine photolyase